MSDYHVSKSEGEQLIAGELTTRARLKIIRHLASGCRSCLDLIAGLLRPGDPDYTDVMRRIGLSFVVARGRVDEERVHARSLWPELQRHSPELRLYMVKNLEEFRTWGIYEIALEKVKTLSRNDPLQAVDMAHLAVTIAELLELSYYGEERKADFIASAYTALANAKRIASDFDGARSALQEAHSFLRHGTGDLYETATLISIESSLTTDLGYLEDAAEMLFPALKMARRLKDGFLEGKLLLQQSSTIGFVDPVLGLDLAQRGLSLLGQDMETHLQLTGRYLIAYWTNDLGDHREASAIIDTYRYLFARFGDVFWTGRLLSIEGRIAKMERDLTRSEFFFRRLVELYSKAAFEFDLALASLDLAEVLASQAKVKDAADILRDLYPVLQRWNLNGDILRSWQILRDGVERRIVHEEAFRELAMTLRRKWYRKGNGEEGRRG